MSVRQIEGRFEVRWRDKEGRHRSRRFRSQEAAREFNESIHDQDLGERRREAAHGRGGGVYRYETGAGTRWRYVVRRSDGSMTSKRGFSSETAARNARRRAVEKTERREVIHTTQTFGGWWAQWLAARRPYLEPNAWRAYEVDGRKRLLPEFADVRLDRLDLAQVRSWMADQAERVEAGDVAAKTVNNALGTLVVCLNAAVRDRVIASNPALGVQRLPPAHIEREYLRLHEIPVYLDSCSDVYRPLAEVLVGAGLRISEALALRVRDMELQQASGTIVVYRSQKGARKVGSTKSDRFRAVEIGESLAGVLRDQVVRRAEETAGDTGGALLFTMPVRTFKRSQGRWAGRGDGEAMDRTTVSREWHKAALQDAALRDMPLHALRHTAAAAWLAGGNSLMYVQRQLGHSDVATTERYYGHLERRVLAAGAVATEEAIARAVAEHARR